MTGGELDGARGAMTRLALDVAAILKKEAENEGSER